MKVYYFLLLFISIALGVKTLASDTDSISREKERRIKLIGLIDEEIKIIHSVKNLNLRLEYRLLELNSEKLKILKQKENNKFLKEALKNNKQEKYLYFKETNKLYSETKRAGLNILKKYKSNPLQGEIFYTLALNSRDYGKDKESLYFLQKARANARGKLQLLYNINTSLAENYYNNKNYKKCITYYNASFKIQEDSWFTKNLFNYSWCQFKENNFKDAISTLEKVYSLSKEEKFIDMREQAVNSLIIFHIANSTPLLALSFIKNNEKAPYDYINTLLKKTSDKGYYQESLKIISELKKEIELQELSKRNDLYTALNMFELNFYQQFKKDNLIFEKSKELSLRILVPEIKEEFIYFIKPILGMKQKIMKEEYIPYSHHFNKNMLREIEGYFQILEKISPEEIGRNAYLLGETYFSIEEFTSAQKQYEKSFLSYIKDKKENESKKSLDSWLAALTLRGLLGKEKKIEDEKIFTHYIHFFPKSKESKEIFPRLVYIYFNSNRNQESVDLLSKYNSYYPEDNNIQRDIYREFINKSIKKKDSSELNKLTQKIRKGFLNFEEKEIEKGEKNLAHILFDQYEVSKTKGKNKDAIDGYLAIFKNDEFTKDIRGEASFLLFLTYIKENNSKEASEWLEKTTSYLPKPELQKRKKALYASISELSLRQDLKGSTKLAFYSIKEFCKDKDKDNEQLFNLSVRNLDALGETKAISSLYKELNTCVTDKIKIDELEQVIAFNYVKNKKYNDLINFLKKKKDSDLANYVSSFLFSKLFTTTDLSEYKKIIQIITLSNKDENKNLILNIKNLENLKTKIKKFKNTKTAYAEDFSPELFNQKLSKRIEVFTKLFEETNHIGENKLDKPVAFIVLTYKKELLKSLINEITSIDLKEIPKELNKQIQKEMNNLSLTFKAELKNIITQQTKLNISGEFLISASHHLLEDDSFTSSFKAISYIASKIGDK